MTPAAESARDVLNVTVRIMGREYTVSCPRNEHEALVTSADNLNERMNAVRRRGKALGAERIAVMVALNLTREVLALQGTSGVVPEDREDLQRIQRLITDIDGTLSAEP